MTDLVAFLRARLDEDWHLAHAASGGIKGRQAWTQVDPERMPGRIEDSADVVTYDEGSPTCGQAMHIARHDPARVLRDVEADRKLLALWQEHDARRSSNAEDEARAWLMDEVLAIRAARFSDHPDYDPDWRTT